MRRNVIYAFIILALSCQGCATVDIRPKSLSVSGAGEADIQKGRQVLQEAVSLQDPAGLWARSDAWIVVARDVWKSSFVRMLTPIPHNDQRVEFKFDLNENAASMTYLNGKLKDRLIGFDADGLYLIRKGSRVKTNSARIGLYLPPVRDYFFWPQELAGFNYTVYLGEEDVGGQKFSKVYVCENASPADKKQDQYIVWVNVNTRRIEYVEFTLRKLLPSYRGVVKYEDYRPVDGFYMPFRIVLPDRLGAKTYSHEFIVESMAFSGK